MSEEFSGNSKKIDGWQEYKEKDKVSLAVQKNPERKQLLSKQINQLDLEKVNSVKDLVDNFKGMSIQARNIGTCAEIMEEMLADGDRPTIFLGLSGALIAGGLRKVISDMVKNNLVDVIVSTGAVLYQDFYQGLGHKHYKGDSNTDDLLLRDLLIDRIYDTYVDEIKFDQTDHEIADWLETLEPKDYSSRELLYLLGKQIKDEESILYQASKNNVPVFSPALCDSSIGIGYTIYYSRHKDEPLNKRVTLDMIRDNYEVLQIVDKSKKTGAIYVGGGTPKNWINDAVVMASYVRKREIDGHFYIFQITTDVPHWGGLSGSTLKEAQSWGKIYKKATKQMVFVEASVALPLIVGSVIQKPELYKDRSRLNLKWNWNELESIY
ncbi:deoxyhypusine synthase family protein [Candidatus Micrarchaeota archaeon]|nr:deoxyhypusine synthase family protein [Candidatus Micrarchaeota archaeon]